MLRQRVGAQDQEWLIFLSLLTVYALFCLLYANVVEGRVFKGKLLFLSYDQICKSPRPNDHEINTFANHTYFILILNPYPIVNSEDI